MFSYIYIILCEARMICFFAFFFFSFVVEEEGRKRNLSGHCCLKPLWGLLPLRGSCRDFGVVYGAYIFEFFFSFWIGLDGDCMWCLCFEYVTARYKSLNGSW